MFINDQRLPHLLQPVQYFAPDQHQQELELLLRPTWHLVGTSGDVERDGDFITLKLLDTPVLVRNFNGRACAFLNVCAHRHAMLTNERRGNTRTLKCQYHGWEYKQDGRTAAIPEAVGFRPWDKKNACLKRFRVETCGDLLFVSLAPSGPTLREHLGPLWGTWERSFDGKHFSLAEHWDVEVPCNWKIPTENSLESYHTTEVHKHTFGPFPKAAHCVHVLEPTYTTFATTTPKTRLRLLEAWMLRELGLPNRHRYEHHLVHPNLQLSSYDSLRLAITTLPLSPTRSLIRTWLFTAHGTKRGLHIWAMRRLIRRASSSLTRRVQAEDISIFPAVQQGLRVSPFPGKLSNREERVHAFQRYVLQHTQAPHPQAETVAQRTSNGSRARQEQAS